MKAVRCDNCKKWCHIKCNGISSKEYEELVITSTNNVDSDDWHCLYCTIKFNNENFVFSLIDNSEMNKLNNCNSMSFCKFIPSFENIAETDKFMNFQPQNENDFDQNIPSLLNSKYYSVNAIQNLNIDNNLNIFHSNINGLGSKFDSLNNFFVESKADFDIVAITETSEQAENSFLSNVEMEGYSFFSFSN